MGTGQRCAGPERVGAMPSLRGAEGPLWGLPWTQVRGQVVLLGLGEQKASRSARGGQ